MRLDREMRIIEEQDPRVDRGASYEWKADVGHWLCELVEQGHACYALIGTICIRIARLDRI